MYKKIVVQDYGLHPGYLIDKDIAVYKIESRIELALVSPNKQYYLPYKWISLTDSYHNYSMLDIIAAIERYTLKDYFIKVMLKRPFTLDDTVYDVEYLIDIEKGNK